ncbi:PD-(D/E)XK nuclease family transposase [Anaerostipes sp.]|uniref:PD-(D/E)XK nuclease family transposase n=1 Tax=Anaerostipes sp. TaxID=1872530 RepID=UPI002E770EF4|nr:PD-(D/E)XK nuclease family transposase [Anaerostipes sp.]MED9813534.1 PD-(D/E)XK nuclease family transposase [Anaerostipes sp.]
MNQTKSKKSLQDLTLLDRFLFAEVMEDTKTFENVLSIILGQDISIAGRPQTEHESRTSPLKRQVCLDVWAEDESDAVYNVEAQKENTKNLPHRSRFYQALIDSKLLLPGEVDFSNMKDCYSIIIAPFDLFGKGLYQYTFQMTCNETEQTLDDGAVRIFFNTHGKNPEAISPELRELLYYMEHTTENISCSTPRLQEIQSHVNIVKSSEEIGVKYMQEWEEKILEKRKARAEGLAEGEDLRLIKLIKKKIQKSKNLIQIADELEETPESIQILYDCVKEHLQQDNEDIYDIYKNMK